jgi:hypothetical protein
VSLETSTTEGGLKASGEPELLLRFNGYIHNVGPGALDFRGSRSSASEPMNAFQRVYDTGGGFKEEPSSAELVYATADGHEHWHLQRAAKYSLWNSARTAEVAPAMKVGFCLDDSEHVEPAVGPKEAVYSDAKGREFCRQRQPEATSLFEGVSAGWRDLYRSGLAFQWVDASNVLPGEYWLREDVNPNGVIKEAGGANTPAYATTRTIIPGFDALAQSTATGFGRPVTVTLSSQAWNDSTTPTYTIASPPAHGTLSAVNGDQVTYTPASGYSGSDAFTFSATDPSSPFPRAPALATVAIDVGEGAPSVAIAGAPSSMIAGTSVQLSAGVSNDSPGIVWSASAGAITPNGLYTAPSTPPATGAVTVLARSVRGARDQSTIAILPVPTPQPAQSAPGGSSPQPAQSAPGSSGPRAMLVGRKLVMTFQAKAAGRLRLSAYAGKRLLGTCVTKTPADRSFTCRVTLPAGISTHARILVVASLRIGRHILYSERRAGVIPEMKMAMSAFAAGSPAVAGPTVPWELWCSPSMLRVIASVSSAKGPGPVSRAAPSRSLRHAQ